MTTPGGIKYVIFVRPNTCFGHPKHAFAVQLYWFGIRDDTCNVQIHPSGVQITVPIMSILSWHPNALFFACFDIRIHVLIVNAWV